MERENNWRRGDGGGAKTGKPEGPYFSYEEVAKKLGGIKVSTVKTRIREAGIRPVRPGRTPYLHQDDIPALIEATRERNFDPRLSARAQQQRRALQRRRPRGGKPPDPDDSEKAL
jgi:hypothetical protein